MNNYFAVYRVPVATMDEWKKTTSPEQMKEQSEKLMKDMMAWMEKHADSFVEKGWPLGKTKSVSMKGTVDSRNDLNYCQIIQAESHEEAADLFTNCPHVQQIPDSCIDIMEISNMGL